MGSKNVLLALDEEVHAALKKAADESGTSVTELLREGADLVLAKRYGGDRARSAALTEALATLQEVAAKLAAGHVLVPREVVSAAGFDGILLEGSTQ